MRGNYQRLADFQVSTTDPDATLMQGKGGGSHLGYHTHYVVDGGKARIILEVLVTPSEVMENQPVLDLLALACPCPLEAAPTTIYRRYDLWNSREHCGVGRAAHPSLCTTA